MRKSFLALILAAGEGTRFKSEKAKILHPLLGKSMLRLVADAVFSLRPEKVSIVIGYQKEEVRREVPSGNVKFICQIRQLGTAHAVMAARKILKEKRERDLLIVPADLPLIRPSALKSLLAQHQREGNSLTLMSAELPEPGGYGRIIRSKDGSLKIVEEKDASLRERTIKEVNGGVYVFKIKDLLQALPKISNLNKKREYYLTDAVEIMSRMGKKIGIQRATDASDFLAINTRYELAKATDVLRERKIRELAEKGVTVYDPHTTWIDLDVEIGRDTVIYSSVIIEGKSRIGSDCRLYPFAHLIDSRVGNHVRILSSTVIEKSIIEDGVQVGPFAHLRPKTVLRSGSKVGNFVEMKNTIFGRRSKAGHLTYLGDSEVEDEVNIGAGTITCNYDGIRKSKTFIERGAFIGSGTELVAPVRVGKGSYIGAGSTITKSVSPGALAFSRAKQIEKPDWAKRRIKKK